MADEITKATMIALLARWQHAWFLQQAQNAIRDEASKKSAEFGKIVNECKAGAKSLGFDRDHESWAAITAEFFPPALELYARARTPDMPEWHWNPPEPATSLPPPPPPPPPPLPLPRSDDPTEEEDFDESKDQTQLDEGTELTTTVREAVINGLKAAPWGSKAAELRASYEQQHGTKLHSKTIGMTLYRLSKETPPLARREGRTWFFVETENPGGETPGQFVRRI